MIDRTQLLTLKLWRALNHPPLRTPLFRRAYAHQYPHDDADLPSMRIPLIGMFRSFGLVVLPVLLVLLGAPMLAMLYYLALSFALFLLPLANTIYGLLHAINASAGITRERERQTYDVLCTSLPGSLGMHWSYCTGWLHYHVIYRYVLLGILVTGIVASMFGFSPQMIFGGDTVPMGVTLIRTAALSALFVIDFVQTIVISSLITLIVPTYAENETNARLFAASTFLALQLAVYVSTVMVTLHGLPGLLALFGFSADLTAALVPVLMLAFFVAVRETLIAGLWHVIEQQLSTNQMELDVLTNRTI